MQTNEELEAIASQLDFDKLAKDYPKYTRKELFLIGLRDAGVCIDYHDLKKDGEFDALKTFVESEGYSAHFTILNTAKAAEEKVAKPKGKPKTDEERVLEFAMKLKDLPGLVGEAKSMKEHLLRGAALMTGTNEIFVSLGILS